jgi:hypothetical protein
VVTDYLYERFGSEWADGDLLAAEDTALVIAFLQELTDGEYDRIAGLSPAGPVDAA